MKKYRIVYLLVVTSVFFTGLWGGAETAPVLLAVLAVLPLFSGMVFYLSLGGFSVSLKGEQSINAGQACSLSLILYYPVFRPAGYTRIRLFCENHVLGTTKEKEYLLEPGRKKHQEYRVSLDTEICGSRTVRLQEVVCYDILGLFSKKKALEEEFTYTVYPYEAQIYVSLERNVEREQNGDIYDGKKSGTDVSEVFGLREYREGDPLQSIHWKLSGKTRQLIVREFGRPVNYHTLVMVSPALIYGEEEVTEEIAGAVFDLGASLSRALMSQDIPHFIGYLSGSAVCCTPIDNPDSYQEMLLKMMTCPIQKNGDNTLLSFLNQQLFRQYTKIVYVAGEINEDMIQNLSRVSDMTVLQVVKGNSGYLTGEGGCRIIRISIESMRSKEHVIPV